VVVDGLCLYKIWSLLIMILLIVLGWALFLCFICVVSFISMKSMFVQKLHPKHFVMQSWLLGLRSCACWISAVQACDVDQQPLCYCAAAVDSGIGAGRGGGHIGASW